MLNDFSRIGYVFKLIQYVEGMKKNLCLAILFNVVFKCIPLIISVLSAYMVSAALAGNSADMFNLFVGIAVLVILSGVFSYLNVLVSHDMAYRILRDLRNAAYDKVDELAPAAMLGKRSGEIISTVLEDVELLEWFYAHTIGQVVVAILLPLVSLALIWMVSPTVVFVLIPFIIVLILIPALNVRKSNDQGKASRKKFAVLNAQIIDGVQGLKDIISFQWQKVFFDRFSNASKDYHNAQLTYALRSADESRLFSLLMGAGGLAAQATVAVMAITGQIEMVLLLPVFVLCSAIFTPLQDALTMSTNYGLIFAASKRLFDLFSEEATIEDTGDISSEYVLKQDPDKITVSFEHIAFSYPTQNGENDSLSLINDLTFRFSTGETVALVGASGSGKTTVTRLLQRFWDVEKGGIYINGFDIRELSLNGLHELITVVPQEVYLFNMSVADNLRLAKLNATDNELIEVAKEAQADQFIQTLPHGYDTITGERGLRLSGGEKQRIAIAQAFLKDAPILVLDEASASLDSETERLINIAVNQLKEGRATLVIAHRISTIKSADRIIVLKDGVVEAEGSYDELLVRSAYFSALVGDEYYEK